MNTIDARVSGRVRRSVAVLTAIVVAAALALTGCGDDADDATDEPSSGPVIEVTGAWARPSPTMAMAGAVYMQITNTGDVDDALVAASMPDTVAGRVEIHETRAAGTADGMGHDTMGDTGGTTATTAPMMEMAPVARIEVPAGETVALEPGGYHIMLLDLAAPLADGDELEVTLTFEIAGEIVTTAVVGDRAP